MNQSDFWDDSEDLGGGLGGGASRRDDPETSHQAGQNPKFMPGRNSMAYFVLTLHLFHIGMTDEDLANLARNRVYDASHRKRRSDLTKAGYLEDSGDRRKTKTGSDAIVWRITQKGRDYLSK